MLTIAFIYGNKIFLRPLMEEDASGLYLKWINNQSGDIHTQHSLFPHTKNSLRRYIEEKELDEHSILLGIITKRENKHVGNVMLSNIDFINGDADFSIIVDPEYQKKGIGSEAIRLILRHAFFRLGLHRVSLGVNEKNTNAINIYKKFGFEKEGNKKEAIFCNNKRNNIIIMGILKSKFK